MMLVFQYIPIICQLSGPFSLFSSRKKRFKNSELDVSNNIKSDHMIKFDSVCLNLYVNLLTDVTQIRLWSCLNMLEKKIKIFGFSKRCDRIIFYPGRE